MDTNLAESKRLGGVPSFRRYAPTPLSLRQRLAISMLITGLNLCIRVAELTDARRD